MDTQQRTSWIDCTDRSKTILSLALVHEDQGYLKTIQDISPKGGKHGDTKVIGKVAFCFFDNPEDKNTTEILFSSGGFFAASLHEDKLKAFNQTYELPKGIDSFVLMSVVIMRALTTKKLSFILAHELGHILLGHLKLSETKREIEHTNGASRIEIAADTYASYLTNISCSINTLLSLRKMFATAYKHHPDLFFKDSESGVLIRKGLRQLAIRVDCLQARKRQLLFS